MDKQSRQNELSSNRFNQYLSTKHGWIEIVANDSSILEIEFRSSKESENPNSITELAVEQLNDYLAGERTSFDLPLEPRGTEFQQTVWKELQEIPFGETWSYLDLALAVGSKEHTRAVGLANGKNPIAIVIPCHRVIGSDGSLTGYAGGLDKKKWLLEHEGVLNQISLF
jgi:methylated-DNA-[protein]-cysteine S-methyltransferase